MSKHQTQSIILLLDNVRSAHNVGSIFRTAEGVGVEKIYCLCTTPVPIDRFGRKRKDLAKVALGAEDLIKWERIEDENKMLELVRKLQKDGWKVVALEQADNAVNYSDVKPAQKMLVIVGNEVGGISAELLKVADTVAEIPMRGMKESLNVSVATGVFLYCISQGL